MLDISLVSAISAIIAAIGVIVGVVLTYLEIRSLVQTRQTDLLLGIHTASLSNEAIQARKKILNSEYKNFDDYREKYWVDIVAVGGLFEILGILLHRKLANADLIIDLFPVKTFWEKLKPYAEEARKRSDRPELYEFFEYLYNEKQKRRQTVQAIQ